MSTNEHEQGSYAPLSAPLVDTHVHVWDPPRLTYAWLADEPTLARPFLLDAFREATEGLEIEAFVFLECNGDPDQMHDEVAMVTALAALDPRLQGIVAQAPLERGDAVRDDLARLAANPLVKGVRRITQSEPDPAFCNRPGFLAGVRALPEFGLTCDLCIVHRQLAETTQLVRACPAVTFMLDHLGKPDIHGGRREPWAQELRELAALPNVWCKLSGVVTEADHARWTYRDIEFYLNHALECFGPDRLAYGGDWPVVTLAAPYRRWAECVARFLAPLTSDERDRICRDNGRAFYRLSP